jgi:hypothetical protein
MSKPSCRVAAMALGLPSIQHLAGDSRWNQRALEWSSLALRWTSPYQVSYTVSVTVLNRRVRTRTHRGVARGRRVTAAPMPIKSPRSPSKSRSPILGEHQ